MAKVIAQTFARDSTFSARIRHITKKQSGVFHKKRERLILFDIPMEKKERKEGKSRGEEGDIERKERAREEKEREVDRDLRKTRRQREEEKEKEWERGRGKRKRSNATITTFAVSSSERAHGLGRCCGVIQSRFRPMNFLQREEGDFAGRLVDVVGKSRTNRTTAGPAELTADWSGSSRPRQHSTLRRARSDLSVTSSVENTMNSRGAL